MKTSLFLLLLLAGEASAQLFPYPGPGTPIGSGPPPVTPVAQLPQNWANSHTCNPPGAYDVTKHIPGDYAATWAGINQSMTDWVAAADQWWHVVITHGTVITGNSSLTMVAKPVGAGMPTKCIVFESDTPLTVGRTVCSHGIQDNVAASTDPGIRNPDCNGSGMSYQLGATVTNIPTGAFTLANGTATNTSAYNDVASMYTLETTLSNGFVIVAGAPDVNGNGPNHIVIRDAEMRMSGCTSSCTTVNGANSSSTLVGLPHDYGFDRIWAHGDATDAGAGTNGISYVIDLECSKNCWVVNSQISKAIRPGSEGHDIYWANGQTLKVVHNWIEGSSIGIFDGGNSTASLTSAAISGVDVEIRRNRMTYPWAWLGNGSGSGSVCGGSNSCVRKNCMEQKGALRYVVDGNICENVDNSGAQNGTITDFNNRACQTACDNYAQTIQDITHTNNIMRHGCGGLVFDGNSSSFSGTSADTPGRNFFISNDLFYDISTVNFGCAIGPNGSVYLGGNQYSFTVTSITRNSAGTISTVVLTPGTGQNSTGLVAGDPITVKGCTSDTSFNVGPYPFVTALTVSGTTITYNNPGTANATTSAGCSFLNGAGWPINVTVDHVTAVGDVSIYMGNNMTAPNATFPRNVTYSNSIFTGTNGFASPGSAYEGTAFVNAFMDKATLLIHHSMFSQRGNPAWVANTAYKLGQVVKPASGSPSHMYTAVTSGTSGASAPAFSGSGKSCVTDNTVTWQESGLYVVPYTEYQVVNVPITPPTTILFPQTDFTYGTSAADGLSVGFSGALNAPTSGTNTCTSGTQVQVNVAIDLADWHGYKLDSSSLGHNAAADSTDMGVSITAIDAAQTSTQYVCKSSCGSGPTPD